MLKLGIYNEVILSYSSKTEYKLDLVKIYLWFEPCLKLRPYTKIEDNRIKILDISLSEIPLLRNYVQLKDIDFSFTTTREKIENVFFTNFRFFKSDEQSEK